MADPWQQLTLEDRTLRVFISSTFRDMQAERDWLVKRTFPRLRLLCERRLVTWSEIDLRWGITEEESRRNQVVTICLDEIDRTRPFFIALLGQRYGWVPERLPRELLAQQPWLQRCLDRSVTEMEILHGVLQDPGMADRRFFYFRDPHRAAPQNPWSRRELVETPGPRDVRRWGRAGAFRRARKRWRRLQRLKQRIKEQLPGRTAGFADPQGLGAAIQRDLEGMVNRLFPADRLPSPALQESRQHWAFALSRRDGYLWDQDLRRALEDWQRADSGPLVVTGEPGMGKSALLANWAWQSRRRHPESLVIPFFPAAATRGTHWAFLLRRVMSELNERLELDLEVPDDPQELREQFGSWLEQAADRRPVELVLDGLDQLEAKDGAEELVWLPKSLPRGVRLLAAARPGKTLETVGARGWAVRTLEPGSPDRRERFIGHYLQQRYRKRLSPTLLTRLKEARQTGNPLFLTTLLEELRLEAEHYTLARRLDQYLEAEGPVELFCLVLQRYERDYQDRRPGLVRDFFSLVWASRRGLSEPELAELLASVPGPGRRLPQSLLSPLTLAAREMLVSRGGLLDFAHPHLAEAVELAYLAGRRDRQEARSRLIAYFQERPQGPRRLQELPWLLERAGRWDQLASLLADPGFFAEAWRYDPYEVKERWATLERESPHRVDQAYAPIWQSPGGQEPHGWGVAQLLHAFGHPDKAWPLVEELARRAGADGDLGRLHTALGLQANIRYAQGRLDQALELNREKERLCRETGDAWGLNTALNNQALILADQGRGNQALKLFQQVEQGCRRLKDRAGLAVGWGNQAMVHRLQGRAPKALDLYEQSQELLSALNMQSELAISLGNQATVNFSRGRLQEAEALLGRKAEICNRLGEKEGQGAALVSRALVSRTKGLPHQALALLDEAESLFRQIGYTKGLANLQGQRGWLHLEGGRLQDAWQAFERQEQACREMGDLRGRQAAWGGKAAVLGARGRREEARRLLDRKIEACRSIGDPAGLALALGDLAALHLEAGEVGEADRLLEDKAALCRELGNPGELARTVGEKARLLAHTGDWRRALDMHRQEEQLFGAIPDLRGLMVSLSNQAQLHWRLGETGPAQQLLDRARQRARELEAQGELASLAGLQGALLGAKGDLAGALAEHRHSEVLARELAIPALRAAALGNQAKALRRMGYWSEAAKLYRREAELCRQAGLEQGRQASLGGQAAVAYLQGRHQEAAELWRRRLELCQRLGDPVGRAESLGGLGMAARQKGDSEEAERLLGQELAAYEGLGAKAGRATALGHLALLRQDQGRWAEAWELWEQAEQLFRQAGQEAETAGVWGQKARHLHLAPGGGANGDRLPHILRLLRDQERVLRRSGDQSELQTCLGNRGQILLAGGLKEQALPDLEEQARICRRRGDRQALRLCLASLVRPYWETGRGQQALSAALESAELAASAGMGGQEAQALHQAAVIRLALGQEAESRELGQRAVHAAQEAGRHDLAAHIAEDLELEPVSPPLSH